MHSPDVAGRATGQDAARQVSAVVVNFNGGDKILACLKHLRDQSAPLTAITVVDNGSTDGSPERIGELFPEAELVLLGANRGLPAARNVGLRRATANLVLLVDFDVYVQRDCVDHLLASLQAHRATVACPRIRLDPQRDVVQCDGAAAHFIGTMSLRHAYRTVNETPAEPSEVRGCIGACLLIDRTRVLEAGGFDEDIFLYLEDHEFCLRLRGFGHRFVCEPRAVVYHDRGAGIPGLSFRGHGEYPVRRAYLTIHARLLTIFVHYRFRTLLVLAPALAAYELASFVLAVSKGCGLQWTRAWLWQLRHASEILRRRNALHRRRVLVDRELLVGGRLPLAPGLIKSPSVETGVNALSALLNGYWYFAKRLIG